MNTNGRYLAKQGYDEDAFAQGFDHGVVEGWRQCLAVMLTVADRQAEPRRTWFRALYDSCRVKAPTTAAELRDQHLRSLPDAHLKGTRS